MKKTKGFTLIELLLVVSIIGVLAAVFMVRANEARRDARNAKRIGDMSQIYLGIKLAQTSATLPAVAGSHCISESCWGIRDIYTANPTIDAYLAPYLPIKAIDPYDNGYRDGGGYIFTPQYTVGLPPGFTPGAYIHYLLEYTPKARCEVGQEESSVPDSGLISCWIKVNL